MNPVPEMNTPRRRALVAAGVVCLLIAFFLQLALSVRSTSMTWDEGDHIFAGYRQWTAGDFGLNPEHPPLVKFVATLPLLPMQLWVPELQNRDFKTEAFLDGRDFLFHNGADAILARTRAAAALFSLVLLLLVFFGAREMFGVGAALLALALLAFEPNLLAHGAYVTTDTALSAFLFASVYAFYRYVKKPSLKRLAVTGLAAGLALASKHTGILVFPTLALLALCETPPRDDEERASVRIVSLAIALIGIGLIALGVLWAFYDFRFQARPEGLALNPFFSEFVKGIKPFEARFLSTLARFHILPESYLYGLADVRQLAAWYPTYAFGKVHAHGVWYYFPAAFAIKSTLGFLALLVLAGIAVATRRLKGWREILFLTVPPAFYLAVAMSSGLNIGVRHILPLYVFLSVLSAGAAWALIRANRRWAYAVAALLVFHVVSSARVFPVYLAYGNEAWGGPSQVYKYLTDSNTDWAQQLKSVNTYLATRGVKQCWFAYFGGGVADPARYGIPCKTLPTVSGTWLREPSDVPPVIDGPVLVSAGTLSGYESGPGPLNPYDQFQRIRPTAVIDYGVFVFDGRFKVGLASAWSRTQQAWAALVANQPARALDAAQAAVAADSNCVRAQIALGDALDALGRHDEARTRYEKALAIARKVEPAFQGYWLGQLRTRLPQ